MHPVHEQENTLGIDRSIQRLTEFIEYERRNRFPECYNYRVLPLGRKTVLS